MATLRPEGKIPNLKSMEGELVLASIPALGKKDLYLVRLHSVEPSGIWIECQDYTDRMMKRFEMIASKTTLVIFVPFQGLKFLLGCTDGISLSETAFGLSDE